MTTESPTIRLHIEADTPHEFAPPTLPQPEIPAIESLVKLFPQVTGWEIGRVHKPGSTTPNPTPPTGNKFGQLGQAKPNWPFDSAIESGDDALLDLGIVDMWSEWPDGKHCANRQQCESLVRIFNQLILQQQSAQRHIELLNAQMATAIPRVASDDGGEILLARMESVLQEGVQVINATASGLYLLDDATRELHLRVQFGLSAESFLRPPRRLKDSMADLEALVGHPFIHSQGQPSLHATPNLQWQPDPIPGIESQESRIRQNRDFDGDNSHLSKRVFDLPEEFPAALCVPVATHSTPLGTLWFFSAQDRVFSKTEIAMAEIIGGRLSAELERESAVREGATSRKLIRDIDRARLWQQLQTPVPLPELDGWEVKGCQFQEQGVGGAIIDYSISTAGELVAAVGDIQGAVFESGLAAASLRAALRTLEPQNLSSDRLLFEINNTLWNCPLGDQIASLFHVRLDPSTGIGCLANAGENGALIIGKGAEAEIADFASPLGACRDEEFESRQRVILPDSTLFAFNSGFRRLFRYRFQKSSDHEILDYLQQSSILKPDEIHQWVEELVAEFDSYRTTPDVSYVAIHRTPETTSEQSES